MHVVGCCFQFGGKYPGVELLGLVVILNTFEEPTNCFLQWLNHFTFSRKSLYQLELFSISLHANSLYIVFLNPLASCQ